MDQSTPGDERELDALLLDSALGLVRAARAALDAVEAVLTTPGGVSAMTSAMNDFVRHLLDPQRNAGDAPAPGSGAPDDGDDLHHIEVR